MIRDGTPEQLEQQGLRDAIAPSYGIPMAKLRHYQEESTQFEYSETKVTFAALNSGIEMQVTAEAKKNLFKTHGGSEKNTGSTAAQIALFTDRINHISGHLDTNKKDHSTTLSLMKLVGKRRRLLNYLMKQDLIAYRQLIEKLGIRK